MSSTIRMNSGCWFPGYSIVDPVSQFLADSASRFILNYFTPEVSPETSFYEGVKNLSEREIIQYVQSGHRPPPGQAFKVRKKRDAQTDELDRSTQLEKSIVVLASGTIFRTGKRKGAPSVPGGNESELLGEGQSKRAFLVEDLNNNRKMAITVSKQKIRPCLAEMKKEAFITNNISSPYILQVRFYARSTEFLGKKIKTGYLESEVCDGGTLKDRPELAQDRAIQAQIIKAVADTHQAGFAHLDLGPGNIAFVKEPNSKLSVRLLDFGNGTSLTPNDGMEEVDAFFLTKIFPGSNDC